MAPAGATTYIKVRSKLPRLKQPSIQVIVCDIFDLAKPWQMSNLNVAHYLDIYQTRLRMQEEGVTNPPDGIQALVRSIVEKLSKMPPEEAVILKNNMMYTLNGEVIAIFPAGGSMP